MAPAPPPAPPPAAASSFILTLPTAPPDISDWYNSRGSTHTTAAALPWLPSGAVHARVHSLCLAPAGCGAPAELDRLGATAGILLGSAHNTAQLARNGTGSALLQSHRRLGKRLPAALVGDFALVLVEQDPPGLQLTTDAVGSVPLWYAADDDRFGAATCRAALRLSGFAAPRRVAAGTRLSVALRPPFAATRRRWAGVGGPDKLANAPAAAVAEAPTAAGYWRAVAAAVRARAPAAAEGGAAIGVSGGLGSAMLQHALALGRVPHAALAMPARHDGEALLRGEPPATLCARCRRHLRASSARAPCERRTGSAS